MLIRAICASSPFCWSCAFLILTFPVGSIALHIISYNFFTLCSMQRADPFQRGPISVFHLSTRFGLRGTVRKLWSGVAREKRTNFPAQLPFSRCFGAFTALFRGSAELRSFPCFYCLVSAVFIVGLPRDDFWGDFSGRREDCLSVLGLDVLVVEIFVRVAPHVHPAKVQISIWAHLQDRSHCSSLRPTFASLACQKESYLRHEKQKINFLRVIKDLCSFTMWVTFLNVFCVGVGDQTRHSGNLFLRGGGG